MENPQAIMTEAMNFMKSRVVLTSAELDLFTKLDEKPLTAAEIAERDKFNLKGLTRVLDCLAALGFVKKEGNCYFNTEKGALFSSRHSETMLPMVLHFNRLWDNWGSLTDTVKGKTGRRNRVIKGLDKKGREAFIGAMHVIGRTLSKEIADSYNAGRFDCLLDIGGASGTYTMAFLSKNPKMKAVLYDLKEVIPLAKKRLESEGFLHRVTLAAGDFYKDELPEGCDLAVLSAIIHQNSPEENIALYKKIYRALRHGGVLLIRDHIMDESRTSPTPGALFAINMLVNTMGGDTYTFAEVRDTLKKAGFVDIKLLRNGEKMDCLVEAVK
ncbi:MAG: methyltransferase [Deltaproteobacteria bacterium]